MLIMLIMLIENVAQSCRLGNKAEFVHWPIGNMSQSKNLTLLTISTFYGRQLDYILLYTHLNVNNCYCSNTNLAFTTLK